MKERMKRFGIKTGMEIISVLVAYILMTGLVELFDWMACNDFVAAIMFALTIVPCWNIANLLTDKMMTNNA